ncbi:MAG TPA: glycosyltransferase [Pirellulales bacterium]|jgi:hypothetical protein|nr:glycosyltransferase [Pirellulales bacterium]
MSATADLSVVMPTYRHAQYLPRALTSLLSQSVRPREVIVVNDASPDETPAILARFAHDDATVKAVHNDRNRGVTESVKAGLARAGGKYLFCVASDDYVLPGFVEKSIGMLERHPQAGLCCSYFSVVDGLTGEIRPNASGWCDAPRYFSPAEAERLLGHGGIAGHTTVFKRSSFDAAGGFLADLEWHSDWFLNFVVAFREGICHVPEMLSLLTEMPGSYASQGLRSARQAAVLNALFDRLASREYSDVAPSFRRSGIVSVFGPPVVQAAAVRRDAWSKAILGLINCLADEQYETLLDDPDPAVGELAVFFLGTFWHEVKQQRERERSALRRLEGALASKEPLLGQREQELAQSEQLLSQAQRRLAQANQALAEHDARVNHLEGTVWQLQQSIRRMESSYFWRFRSLLAACKHALLNALPLKG